MIAICGVSNFKAHVVFIWSVILGHNNTLKLFPISSTFIINICFIVFIFINIVLKLQKNIVLWKSIPATTRVHGIWFYENLQHTLVHALPIAVGL